MPDPDTENSVRQEDRPTALEYRQRVLMMSEFERDIALTRAEIFAAAIDPPVTQTAESVSRVQVA
jgi:hypothetical protein